MRDWEGIVTGALVGAFIWALIAMVIIGLLEAYSG